MREIVAVVLGVALTCAGTAASQTRPDFSGRWTTEAEAPPAGGRGAGRGARGDMGSGWGPTITIRQAANILTVEYAFFSRGDMQPPLSFKYALDGSPTKNSVMMGRGVQVQTSKAAWDNDKLVITNVHTLDHPETPQTVAVEVRQTLSLDPSGLLVVETLRRGVLGGPDTTTRVVYRKAA